MSPLPEPVQGGESSLVPRRLSNEQFELVIRRAAELQARAAESGDEGMTESEILRIGKELGLSGAYLNQALAEVRSGAAAPPGLLDRVMGSAVIQASRVVPGEVEAVKRRLESYLVQTEFYCVLRRLPDRTLFEPAPGAIAAVGRAAKRAFSRSASLRVSNLEVAVQPLEEGFCHVTVLTRLTGERTGYLAGGVLSSGAMGGMAAAVLGVAIDPAAAVVGLPVFGTGVYAWLRAYSHSAQRTHVQLEGLLDRLEHRELPGSVARLRGRTGP